MSSATSATNSLSLHDALPIADAGRVRLGAEAEGRQEPGARDHPRRHHERVTGDEDRKSTRLNSSHGYSSYADFCLKKKNQRQTIADAMKSGAPEEWYHNSWQDRFDELRDLRDQLAFPTRRSSDRRRRTGAARRGGRGPPGTRRARPSAAPPRARHGRRRSEEHTSELQSRLQLVCRLLLEKKKSAPDNSRCYEIRSPRRVVS